MHCRIRCSALFVLSVVVWSRDASCVHCSTSRKVTFTVHTARILAPHNHRQHKQCRTPYAAVHTLVLLVMGIMMPETCCDRSLILNIRLVASCWFLSLYAKFMVHGQKSPKFTEAKSGHRELTFWKCNCCKCHLKVRVK